MTNIHDLTETFMLTAGQTVRQVPSIPTVEEMKLRLNLEFEELFEKAEAMGLLHSFIEICSKSIGKRSIDAIRNNETNILENGILKDTNEVNLVEVFDAALDQRVVASGTDLCFGFQHIIEAGDEEVFRSNMSKFDINQFDADATYEKYQKEGIDTEFHIVEEYFVCKRVSDKKILKSHNYSPTDLKGILEIGEVNQD